MSTSAENRKIFLTTPLYYVNARPHLGHAYTTLLADTLKRFYRQRGAQVLLLSGTDEHGEKIAAVARQQNRTPRDYADEVSKSFSDAWKAIGLEIDIFYRTTQASHYRTVQSALQQLKDRGEIYFATYEGKYCVGCERFRTDQEWTPEGLCPDHLTPPDYRKESNYFFKMSAYQARLKAHYEKHPELIQPQNYLKETLSFLEQPLDDLCISRPTTRLEWGIPLPFDSKYVTYVWFDALMNYPAGIGYDGDVAAPTFRADFWAGAHHLIGKDILKTHAVYWPTMLMALGLPLFHRLLVGGFWLSSGTKMSKSLGNVVDPLVIHEKFGIEPFRYFLLREMSYGGDASFSWEGFIARANSELANGIGNLASRVLTLSHKYLGGAVPSRGARGPAESELLSALERLPEEFVAAFEGHRFHIGLMKFSEAVATCDRYINDQKPWALGKDPAQLARLEAVLGTAMDALWTLSVTAAAALPEGSAKLRAALGRADAGAVPSFADALTPLVEGSRLGEVPRLYPRLELPKE